MSERKFSLPTLIAAIFISVVLSVAISYTIISRQPGPTGPQGPQGEVGLTGPKGEQGPEIQRKTFGVNIGFDYGNGTVNWFNDTRIDIGDGIMQATLQAVEADYILWFADEYTHFVLTRLDDIQSGESEDWYLWAYMRHEEWPDGWYQWYPWGSGLDPLIPLPNGFTCLWRWTT